MNDILGRELKDGDLCVGMAIGRNSQGMHIGVFKGSSIAYLSYSKDSIVKSCTSNTYLIENPTEQELAIKNEIKKFLIHEETERKRKASLKTIPLSKLEVGGIYKTTQNELYIYLGKRKVIFETPYKYDEPKIEEGNCFAYIYSLEDKSDKEILDFALSINTYREIHNIDVLKGNKKLIEMVKKINLKFPLVKTEKSDYRYDDEIYKLTIE